MGERATEAQQLRAKPRPLRAADAAEYDVVYKPPPPAEPYLVVHSKAVAVRSDRTTTGKPLGARVPGETVLVEEVVNGWARIRNDGRIPRHAGPLWMLIDGTSLGIGPLLRPAPPRAPTETGGEESDDDDETGDFGG